MRRLLSIALGALMAQVLGVVLAVTHPHGVPLEARLSADKVVIQKGRRHLHLLKGQDTIRTYRVALGRDPVGPKETEGDGRTPEGEYIIDYRKPNSSFHRALHISYPNTTDRAQARRRNVSPGGLIMIHGLPNGFGWLGGLFNISDWTDGCVAVTNSEIEEIWDAVPNGTPVSLLP